MPKITYDINVGEMKSFMLGDNRVIITPDTLTIMIGAWSYNAYNRGRSQNDITPKMPLDKMTDAQLLAFAKRAIKEGLKQQKDIEKYFTKLV